MSASLFDRSTAVASAGAGRYSATVDAAWNGPVSPNGGVLTATMLHAAQAELGDAAPPPRTVSAQFLQAPAAGPVELDVEVLRREKRVCACEVRMRQGDTLSCTATVIFSAARSQQLDLHEPPPAAAQAPRPPLAGGPTDLFPPVFGQLELAPLLGPGLFSAGHEALAGGWIALRDDPAPLDPGRLCALCDLWWPAIFSVLRGPMAVPTLQLTVHLRESGPLSDRFAFARFRTSHVQEGHLEETGELWSAGGRMLAHSQQLSLALPLPDGP